MPDILMPALSPTMEAGTLARWLKKEGDPVKPGDVLAEIETDKATMEVEAIDEGTLTRIVVPDGTEDVRVGALIAVIAGEGEETHSVPNGAGNQARPVGAGELRQDGGEVAANTTAPDVKGYGANPAQDAEIAEAEARLNGARPAPGTTQPGSDPERVRASPLARRLAELRGIDLGALTGSGPGGRIVKADVDAARDVAPAKATAPAQPAPAASQQPAPAQPPARQAAAPAEPPRTAPPAASASPAPDIPHEAIKLSNMRKVIARRLTESKQTVPHYYLAVDVRLDALLKLRAELNASLGGQGVKLSVNDLLIKALALALRQVPDANVSFTGDSLLKFSRADISVAVAIPAGLITPIIVGADQLRVSEIATRMKELAARAKDGKLQPHEYQGGTASLSNLGMYGIKQFKAVINPPQGMILAVGAGDRRPWVEGDAIVAATIMTATGSFDHRAIDGAVGAQLMHAFRGLVDNPLTMLA
jgi:pyruvate dehydrogenase E2 component (dihydrolipoamide acetyltransferase)